MTYGSNDTFKMKQGQSLGDRYVVDSFIGSGWEGEVYSVIEQKTGVRRAAKLFFPERNPQDSAVRFYANKLDRLRRCSIVIQYHHSVSVHLRDTQVTCLISELVDGELLSGFIARQPGKRMTCFEALHLLHSLVDGLEQIHRLNEYHGDLHSDNVLVKRQGIGFEVRLVDFYYRGASSRARRGEDIIDVIRLFYDALGGKDFYAGQPQQAKSICRGLRHDLINKRFPNITRLREHLELLQW